MPGSGPCADTFGMQSDIENIVAAAAKYSERFMRDIIVVRRASRVRLELAHERTRDNARVPTLLVVRRRRTLCRLPRPRVGIPRRRRPPAVREGLPGRVPGGLELAHDPEEARGLSRR